MKLQAEKNKHRYEGTPPFPINNWVPRQKIIAVVFFQRLIVSIFLLIEFCWWRTLKDEQWFCGFSMGI